MRRYSPAAEALYTALGAEATLYDDRELSAGVKLKDADLLGMPLRITVGARSLAAGGAELRLRATGETRIAALDEVAPSCRRYACESQKSGSGGMEHARLV